MHGRGMRKGRLEMDGDQLLLARPSLEPEDGVGVRVSYRILSSLRLILKPFWSPIYGPEKKLEVLLICLSRRDPDVM